MRNLVIIGNGFDLAHGLKTSYKDFIEYVIEQRIKDPDLFDDLFFKKGNASDIDLTTGQYIEEDREGRRILKNSFFKAMLTEVSSEKWCDVEKMYFNHLLNCIDNAGVKKLNDEFATVKSMLCDYLEKEDVKLEMIESYRNLFQLFDMSDTLVLNFNYTDSVKKYLVECKNIKLIHIHGELYNPNNPVVFGFAANHEESRKLILKDFNDYLYNIKKYNYKKANNESTLIGKLSEANGVDVYVIGHSCGISDKLILNQIFIHEGIENITVFYHDNKDNYMDAIINIDRIMNDEDKFDRIKDFSSCCRMAQRADGVFLMNEFKEVSSSIFLTNEDVSAEKYSVINV